MMSFTIIYLFAYCFVIYNLHFISKYHTVSCKVDHSTWHTSVREITIPRARVPIIYIHLFSLNILRASLIQLGRAFKIRNFFARILIKKQEVLRASLTPLGRVFKIRIFSARFMI